MIIGKFKREANRRFIAFIDINGKEEACYMATSSKFKKLYDLKDKEVLLEKNIGKNTKTKYVVQALKDNKEYIWLNLKALNDLYYKKVLLENDFIIREKQISNKLRIDFFNSKTKELIEVKGILSENEETLFPTFKTERFLRQLKEINNWKYSKKLIIILMNPNIKRIKLNEKYEEIYYQLKRGLENGLKIEIFRIVYDEEFSLKKVPYKKYRNSFKI